MPNAEPSCQAFVLRPFLARVGRASDRAALLRAHGLDESTLARPEAPVPLARVYALVERLVEVLREPWLGLGAGLALGDDGLGALGFLGITSATLGEGLEAMLAHTWPEGERYELAVAEGRAHLRYHPWGERRPAHVQLADFFLADLCANVPRTVEGGLDGVRAATRAGSDRAARLAEALRVEVAPRAPFDAVSFDAACLDRPMRRADPALRAFFEGYLARHAEAPASWAARAGAVVDARLPDGALDAASLARALGTSRRTLQRRLRAEGTSPRALVRERRLARAQALLDAGRTPTEAAGAVGYSEASALHRALRRRRG
ncbi:MAG TPA: AraC family transcriptional regulator ligand-binding domain-containing protein [Sandaracinaceae bacterium LLY-WYZ-13_1]|nr:AraC family transcriptional regulator ligand-binding domain-containing protein [Sandaracinaceae bacterium LLY-WYZ-13_1]